MRRRAKASRINMTGVPSNPESRETGAVLFRSVQGWAAALLVALVGALSFKHLGVPNMVAAQVTVGLFGLAGGLSHALVRSWAGVDLSRKQGLFLSVAWSLSCIGGVTPLFLTSGTPLKMAVLAFYSFGVFGALGGSATAFTVKSCLEKASALDPLPSVLAWSFCFALAAVIGNVVGEGLGRFVPPWISWPNALGAVALLTGAGGGYCVVSLLKEEDRERGCFENAVVGFGALPEANRKGRILTLVLLSLPFYLNDFLNIHIKDWRLWILVDYTAVKLFPCLVVLWLIRSRRMAPAHFGLSGQRLIPFVAAFLIGTLAATFIDQNGPLLLNHFRGYPALGRMPEIQHSVWNWIDLTFGLLLVGLVEELVFRGYLYAFLIRYMQKPFMITAFSAVAFGFAHWSGGFQSVFISAACGAVFMVIYMRTRSLPAVMLAHFAVDFIDYAEVIPKTIFRFL